MRGGNGLVSAVVGEPDDPAAMLVDALYRTHAPRLRQYIFRRTSDNDLADDICHDTFCRLLAALRGEVEVRHNSGYLHRIAHNLIVDYYRHRAKLGVESLDEIMENVARHDAGGESPRFAGLDREHWMRAPLDLETDVTHRLDFADYLRRASAVMADSQAAVLQMRYFDGYAFAEIAANLSITEGAAKQRNIRGVDALRRYAEERQP